MNGEDRFHRQTLLPQIGPEGQRRLGEAHVVLVGCGALGGAIAEQLVRAGVGSLRLIDRDLVEWSNLQRQVLFDESDARENLPKAVAAARRLAAINSTAAVVPVVADLHPGNAEAMTGLDGQPTSRAPHLILDGTDNVETRYLLNDVSVKHGVAWVYGGCVGAEGRVMAIRPPETACLRCVFPHPHAPGELPTCDTAGVLGPAVGVVASLQALAALKLLTGNAAAISDELLVLDLWANRMKAVSLTGAKSPDCVACGRRQFEFLGRGTAGRSVGLCGRNAVQVSPSVPEAKLDLDLIAKRLAPSGEVERTPYLLRCQPGGGNGVRLTVFPDGRVIVHGTTDIRRARSLYARYIGT